MKKTKRILALIGAILLLLLYVVAFVATVLDHTSDMRYWKAAVAATIIIPDRKSTRLNSSHIL